MIFQLLRNQTPPTCLSLRLRALLLALLTVVCALLPHSETVLRWDDEIMQALTDRASRALDIFFQIMTTLGGGWAMVLAIALPTLFLLTRRRWAAAIFYGVGVGVLKLASYLLKILIARPRPSLGDYTIDIYSMPSGHAFNAVVIYGLIATLLLRKWHSRLARVVVVTLALLMVLLTGASRVYLQMHYPSDVLMGALLAFSGLWLLEGMWRRYGQKNDAKTTN